MSTEQGNADMVTRILYTYFCVDELQVEAQKREREGTSWSEEEQAAFKAKIAERCPAIRQCQS